MERQTLTSRERAAVPQLSNREIRAAFDTVEFYERTRGGLPINQLTDERERRAYRIAFAIVDAASARQRENAARRFAQRAKLQREINFRYA